MAAIKYFEQLQAKCPNYHSDVPYLKGVMYYAQDQFAEAAKSFEAFRNFPSDDPAKLSKDYDKQYTDVEAVMPELQFYVDFYKNTAPLNPQLVRNVSTPAKEYLPMLSPDNELTVLHPGEQAKSERRHRITRSGRTHRSTSKGREGGFQCRSRFTRSLQPG
jgi:tetratricopeptide (TPR) repeat protein